MSKIINFLKERKSFFWVLYFPIYFFAFSTIEHMVLDDYWVSHTPLDDFIPFTEEFIIFYLAWFVLMLGFGIYFFIVDIAAYRRYMYFIMISYSLACVFFLLFPTGQDMRPAVFENNNIFTKLVKMIYDSDTNTNVLPSIHVVGTMAVIFGVYDDCTTLAKKHVIRGITVAVGIMIILSTVFIKQHSVLDIYVAIPYSLLVMAGVYFKNIKNYYKNKKTHKITEREHSDSYAGVR